MSTNCESIRISVVVPVYNNERWIGRALDSVLGQSRRADEIIVVDDGSTDNTAAIAAGYGSAVRLIRQGNAGVCAARNTGILAATGNWIAFLDSDDEWLEDKLRLQEEHLRRHPDLQWTTGNCIECLCSSGYQAPALTLAACQTALGDGEVADDYLRVFRQGLSGNMDTILVRRDLVLEVGGFLPGKRLFEDIDLWLRIAYRQPRVGFLAQPLAIYHLEAGEHASVTHQANIAGPDLIERHLKLSADQGRLEAFRPLAVHLLRGWMRGMLFHAELAPDIRRILMTFDGLLPASLRWRYYALTVWPRVTSLGCRGISRLVRLLGLRRRAVRKPPSAPEVR